MLHTPIVLNASDLVARGKRRRKSVWSIMADRVYSHHLIRNSIDKRWRGTRQSERGVAVCLPTRGRRYIGPKASLYRPYIRLIIYTLAYCRLLIGLLLLLPFFSFFALFFSAIPSLSRYHRVLLALPGVQPNKEAGSLAHFFFFNLSPFSFSLSIIPSLFVRLSVVLFQNRK